MSIVFEYIDRLDEAINTGQCDDELILDTVSTFSNIDGIRNGLDRYRSRVMAIGSKVSYDNLGDARRLRDKLRKYAEERGMKRSPGSATAENRIGPALSNLVELKNEATRLFDSANPHSIESAQFATWQACISRFFDRYPQFSIGYRDRLLSIAYATEYCGSDELESPRAADDFRQGMRMAIALLDSMIGECEAEESQSAASEKSSPGISGERGRVFIVHGRDDAARLEVKMLLKEQGIEAIVLFEQANGGMTIIEKLEANFDVHAAIFLLTADDEGHLRSGGDLKPRARQNVVFEAGMFIGRLGRGNVAFVVDSGIELPSDIKGIGYIEHKDGWKLELLRELKAMGFEIDANKLIER